MQGFRGIDMSQAGEDLPRSRRNCIHRGIGWQNTGILRRYTDQSTSARR